jgi:hypothetical protein
VTQDASREAQRTSLPVSVALLGRRSLLGGAVVLGLALFYILGVPALNGLVPGENPFKVGEPYVLFDGYQITPQDGWELENANELFVTLTKAGAGLVFTGPVAADITPEAAVETASEGLKAPAWSATPQPTQLKTGLSPMAP